MARTGDGKTVVAGTSANGPRGSSAAFYLTRYDTSGRVDPAFGNRGVSRTSFGGWAHAFALAQHPDGRLVVAGLTAGRAHMGVGVARYTADGKPDVSFGVNGTAVAPVPGGAVPIPGDVQVDLDGSVYVGGIAVTSDGRLVPFVQRLLPTGTPDPSFGSQGTLFVALATDADAGVNAIEVLPGGAVVAAGTSRRSGGTIVPFLVRILPGGTQDSTFPGDLPALAGAVFGALALAPDGGLVVAGSRASRPGADPTAATVVRFLPTGTLDASFGTAGVATARLDRETWLYDVDVLPDGRVVASGEVTQRSRDMLLVRLTRLGQPDTAFGRGGVAIHGTHARHESAHAQAVAPDGTVTVTGMTAPLKGTVRDSVTARFLG